MKNVLKITLMLVAFLLAITIATQIPWLIILISVFSLIYLINSEADKKMIEYAKYGVLVGFVGFAMSYFHVDLIEDVKSLVSGEEASEQVVEDEPMLKEDFKKNSYRAKEIDYINFIIDNSNSLSSAYSDFNKQLAVMAYSDEWVVKMTIIIDRIGELTNEVMDYDELSVPSGYNRIHDNYLLGAIMHNESMKLFSEGFNRLDEGLMKESAEAMNEGNEYVDEAIRLLNEKREREDI